jgi:hypothetical protein
VGLSLPLLRQLLDEVGAGPVSRFWAR